VKLTLLSIMILLTGCSSPGILAYRQVDESAPTLGKAPEDGTYGLFIAGQQQDLYEVPLKAGDPLGFQWSSDGIVKWMYAIAGADRNRLDLTQTYEWRRLP
jgi:hypothetical protein